MAEYRPTIGLEIHAELATVTKMFCRCQNNPEDKTPNVYVCPVCMAYPGALPVINKEAVHQVLRVGVALNATLADFSEFDRKSYFYPDIPKGYQISQYKYPLVSGGSLLGVDITRVHLEEDTARSSHEGDVSLVDFNRAGVPLMELVTEPVIHDAKTAGNFARELQLLLKALGASEANLEKGQMRVEANISVSKTDTFGTKVEVKNLNSFKSVEAAIDYEIARHIQVLESGGTILQETRGFNEDKGETFSQRLKEGSADYRYFPEPDLPKLYISKIPEWSVEALRASLPELPAQKRSRYESLALSPEAISYISASNTRSDFFDAVITAEDSKETVQLCANYFVSDLAGFYAKNGGIEFEKITPKEFRALIEMVQKGDLSSRGAKDVLTELAQNGGGASKTAQALGVIQNNDAGFAQEIVAKVTQNNPAVVAEYKGGKESSLMFLVGQAMKESKGKGNPAMLKEALISILTEI
jgi:aspartyl-tRNA(Asn)/glutamyl-tRNA(Gln) amidotransferase subunit B